MHSNVKGALAQEDEKADTTLECSDLQAPQSVAKQKCVHRRLGKGWGARGSVSHGAGGSEVREELEAQADDKVPDVSGHLRAGDEDAPDQNHQDGVERVAYVSQPEGENRKNNVRQKWNLHNDTEINSLKNFNTHLFKCLRAAGSPDSSSLRTYFLVPMQ